MQFLKRSTSGAFALIGMCVAGLVGCTTAEPPQARAGGARPEAAAPARAQITPAEVHSLKGRFERLESELREARRRASASEALAEEVAAAQPKLAPPPPPVVIVLDDETRQAIEELRRVRAEREALKEEFQVLAERAVALDHREEVLAASLGGHRFLATEAGRRLLALDVSAFRPPAAPKVEPAAAAPASAPSPAADATPPAAAPAAVPAAAPAETPTAATPALAPAPPPAQSAPASMIEATGPAPAPIWQ